MGNHQQCMRNLPSLIPQTDDKVISRANSLGQYFFPKHRYGWIIAILNCLMIFFPFHVIFSGGCIFTILQIHIGRVIYIVEQNPVANPSKIRLPLPWVFWRDCKRGGDEGERGGASVTWVVAFLPVGQFSLPTLRWDMHANLLWALSLLGSSFGSSGCLPY